MTVKLYRAACDAEVKQAIATSRLSVIPGSLEGKWFAENVQDAVAWGGELTRLSGIAHDRILEVEIRHDATDRLFRLPMLDGIGPARFAALDDLEEVAAVREAKP